VTIDGKEYTVLKDPPVIDSLDFIGVVLEIPIDAEDAESIVSGPDGATLKKVENGFLLLEGEAYLVD
jgi:DNA/RNA-binding domain of Phe-tRNA-synthetase-like protein